MKNKKFSYAKIYLDNPNAGIHYDRVISNKFEEFIFSMEKSFLRKIFDELKTVNMNYLDFASGTGRIIAFVSKNYNFSGLSCLDLSENMMKIARKKTKSKKVEFVVGNIEKQHNLFKKKFDIITAFRLILNLEHDKRLSVLRELNKLLNKDGVLIVNNHMNRYSFFGIISFIMHKYFGYPLKGECSKPGCRTVLNTMSDKEARELFEMCGFSVVKAYRFTLIPGYKNTILLPEKFLFNFENLLSKVTFLNLFSKDIIYVCKKK